MTGRVHFGNLGIRDSFTLGIVELTRDGLHQVSVQCIMLHVMIRVCNEKILFNHVSIVLYGFRILVQYNLYILYNSIM